MGYLRLMRSLPLLSLCAVLLTAGFAGAAEAAKKGVYEDTKKRFKLKLPSGWRITPMPGDTRGMAFRKDVDDAFALFSAQVHAARPGETLDAALERATLPFAAEIGFRQGADVPTSVGSIPSTRRSVTAFVSGDRRMVRAAEITVLVAFGHVHVLHFEALQEHKARFSRDLDRMLASYEALAGRRVYAPLVGRWQNEDPEKPSLYLAEDNRFTLGDLEGFFAADGASLILALPEGKETFRYRMRSGRMTLSGANLDEPMRFRRSGGQQFHDVTSKKRRSRLTRDMLVGRWRVIDNGGSDPGTMVLAPSGAIAFGGLSGRWRFRRGLLTITSAAGETVTYHVSHDGEGIVLGGGDFDREVRLRPE
jgi:hypothetical protein